MIQLSAPSHSASAAKSNGAAASAAPNGAETGGFAALLGAAGNAEGAPESAAADMTALLAAALAGLPDGKTGKASGKSLPVGEIAGLDDLETKETPDEATSDLVDVPIAAAIPVLPLLVPPLPGTGSPVEFRPVEFRAAGPDSATMASSGASSGASTGSPPVLPATASRIAQIATAAPVAQQAAAQGLAPAQVLQAALAPIVTTGVQQQTEGGTAQPAPISTAAQIVAMKPMVTADTQQPHVEGASQQAAPISTAAQIVAMKPMVTADTQQPQVEGASQQAALIVTATPLSATKTANADQPLVARPVIENTAPKPAPAVKGTADVSANTAPAADIAAQDAASPLSRTKAPGDASAEKATKSASLASAITLETGGELKVAEGAPQPATQISGTQTFTATRPADTATVAPATGEQPHDFATLVSRLTEAREAASPQIVSTALHHAEFGKISLQFRQDDANLSVTMANADPAFTAAVHGAVAASLGGNAAGDQPREGQQNQHQQQQQATAQQQSASSGNGQGQGQQQAAQARAENGERTFNRGQATSARSQQGDGEGRAETDTRRSGIYA